MRNLSNCWICACAVPTAAVTRDVSFVYACGKGCILKEETGERRIEREETQLTGTISFHHDPNNQIAHDQFHVLYCIFTDPI